MSKFDSRWSEQQHTEATSEGWELGFVVDSGKPITAAYLDIFDSAGPRFPDRRAALAHVIARAKERSKLHLAALSACSSSRVEAAARTTTRTARRK